MNAILRARVGLDSDARVRLGALRACLLIADTLSKSTTGRPFFGLRESEALMRATNGKTGTELVRTLLHAKGPTTFDRQGAQNVPAKGPVIIASTHPTGMFDYVAHAGALMDRRQDLKVVATAEAKQFLSDDVLITVDVDAGYRATSSRSTLRSMAAHLKDGGALLVFGSGRVSHKSHKRLIEPEWRAGPSVVSKMCDAPLIPAALNACNSDYYYRLRGLALRLSGDEHFGALFGSVRHIAEFIEKLGGHYSIVYGDALPPGTPAPVLKSVAEGLVPGLYRPA